MRLRVRWTKAGKIRFSSHRDMARCWERAIRLSEIPIATSEGFTPRPKVHFGLALSTGHESLGEYLDLDLGPGIINLRVVGAMPSDAPELGALLEAELATQPRSVRPAELLAAFDPPRSEGRVRRTHQWITIDGATREPLSPSAPLRVPAQTGAR